MQVVFAVKGRSNLISPKHKEELQKYTTGIIQTRKHKLLAINYMPDHAHIFFSYNPTQLLGDLVKDIKIGTNNFIKAKEWVRGRFQWQEGYGAFSYSRSQIDRVIKYINNQEKHHQKRSFKDEYLELLKKFEIEFKEKYLFEFYE